MLSSHANYTWSSVNVGEEQQIIQALNAVDAIDTLIVSAGKHLSATILDTCTPQLVELVNLNLFGAYWLIQHALPIMIKQNYGNIVTIGSDQYLIAKPHSTVYGMTKAALAQLTKSIALDYAANKIRANCIGCGTINTPLYRRAIENYAKKSDIDISIIEGEENAQQPLGRIGNADEVAQLAFFLASAGAEYITGAYIPIDGGYTIK